jgi:prepilin-type N-terminal cleavage/methylation domain-containing protein
MPYNNKGFTMIELFIVVSVIAILAAIAVPNFLEAQIRSKRGRTLEDMAILSDVLEAYALRTGHFPANQMARDKEPYTEELFNNGWALAALTTPVPYVTKVPIACISPDSRGRNTKIPPLPYAYWRFDAEAAQRGDVPQAILFSVGPSGEMGSFITTNTLHLTPYDCSNGSASPGDLYVTFPSSPKRYETPCDPLPEANKQNPAAVPGGYGPGPGGYPGAPFAPNGYASSRVTVRVNRDAPPPNPDASR